MLGVSHCQSSPSVVNLNVSSLIGSMSAGQALELFCSSWCATILGWGRALSSASNIGPGTGARRLCPCLRRPALSWLCSVLRGGALCFCAFSVRLPSAPRAEASSCAQVSPAPYLTPRQAARLLPCASQRGSCGRDSLFTSTKPSVEGNKAPASWSSRLFHLSGRADSRHQEPFLTLVPRLWFWEEILRYFSS